MMSNRNLGPKSLGGMNPVAKLYETVIEDVISNIREAFLDDGVDDQVLQELKQSWETKLRQTKATDNPSHEEKSVLKSAGPLYRYTMPAVQAGATGGQQIVYQSVALSNSSQQATLALPAGNLYPKGTNIIQVPANQNQQMYRTAYQQPVILQGQQLQIARTSVTSTAAPGTLVLARNPTQSTVPTTTNQTESATANPSAIIQVDGASDDLPSTSKDNTTSRKPNQKMKKLKPIKKSKKPIKIIFQYDGLGDSSEEEDDSESDESDNESEEEKEDEGVEEEPLCTDDDDSDQSADELFDTENVVVCQYDKIHRSKSKWKFTLKTGIMNLKGKDQAFQKATGEAEW